MFNAKAFMTGKSAFHSLSQCGGFLTISTVIIGGQWLIVTFGGEMFNVVPLSVVDWAIIIISTSVVLWVGEVIRFIKK